MLKNSACFIIFLIAIFFAVPVVSTLLIYEIEIVRNVPHSQGTDNSAFSFLADNGTVLNISPDPILLSAQMNADAGLIDSGDRDGMDMKVKNLYRYSGVFAGPTDKSGAPEAALNKNHPDGHYSATVPIATDFSIRLPGIGNRSPVIVKFNRTSELPTSAAMFFLGTGLIGIAGLHRKKYKRRIRRYRKIM